MPGCGACGAQNRDAARFCDACGSALARRCGACDAELRPGARFCDACGTPVAAAEPPAATAERRLVSVLFADLVGFTTLSEHRDPEEVRELLSRYFDRCRTLIERYGGVVEKFIGDAVMAVWGTPVAREDDADRAVRAALALTQAVTALGPEVGMPGLRVRAGVLTGPASVELGTEGEGMVLGDTVNTAARLQSIAAPGAVLVDDVTRRATEAGIAYEDAGSHTVKGRDQPVRTWTALRVVAGVGGTRRIQGLEPPFVGRRRELDLLIHAWERSVRDGAARRVTVVGEAGSGKSRLLWELFKHVDGVADPVVWWHQGRCLSYGEGVGYWALAEMVRSRAGIAEEESPEAARAKLRETVERIVTDERERALVEPRLAHLLGLERRATSDRADLYSGWRLFFERMAATNPVTLVFEDLQWADSGLLDFIDHLLEWSGRLPIFVLALGRPELRAVRPQWPHDVVLAPLPPEAVHAMLEGLVPGLTEDLARRIVDHAEGVPLYAVETVRMLVDQGVLTQDGARYALTGDVGALDIPETLHALVAARLDGLPPTDRAVLQDAAVFGQAFSAAAVASVGQRAEPDVRRVLDGLCAKQLMRLDDDERSPERGQYHFLQAMVRSVAYGTLSRRDRKARHLAAARHLQEMPDSADLAEVLAAHFVAAAEADPEAADAARVRASACETLAEAGRRALSLALGAEALRAFDHAAALAEDPLLKAELLEQAGRAIWLADDLETARDRLASAIAGYEAAGDPARAAHAKGGLAAVLWYSDDFAAAIELATEALAGLAAESLERAELAALVGNLRVLSGAFDAGIEALDEALVLAERHEHWPVLADALISRGSALSYTHRPQEGRAVMERGLHLAEAHDLPAIALRGVNNLGWLAERADDDAAVAANVGRALELARARGDRPWERLLVGAQARLYCEQGDWDAVERLVAPLVDSGLRAQDHETSLALAIIMSGRGRRADLADLGTRAHEWTGDPDAQLARTMAVVLALVAEGSGDHERVSALLAPLLLDPQAPGPHRIVRLLGASALALGRPDDARSIVDTIDGLPPVRSRPATRASADHLTALLAVRDGDDAAAERAFADSARRFAAIGRPFELAITQLDHGESLLRSGQSDGAEPLLRAAHATFERLGAAGRAEHALALLHVAPAPRESGTQVPGV